MQRSAFMLAQATSSDLLISLREYACCTNVALQTCEHVTLSFGKDSYSFASAHHAPIWSWLLSHTTCSQLRFCCRMAQLLQQAMLEAHWHMLRLKWQAQLISWWSASQMAVCEALPFTVVTVTYATSCYSTCMASLEDLTYLIVFSALWQVHRLTHSQQKGAPCGQW